MGNKEERQKIGFRIFMYVLSSIIGYFQKQYGTETEVATVQHLLDTKEERKGFLKEILIFIMQKLLALLTSKSTKKISQAKLNLNTAKRLYIKK